MAECKCQDYEDLELLRDAITERMKASPRLKKRLQGLAEHPGGEHKLFVCQYCHQMWQASRAWSWGNHEYVFKIPQIESSQWIEKPFAQPDELLIYTARMNDYI